MVENKHLLILSLLLTLFVCYDYELLNDEIIQTYFSEYELDTLDIRWNRLIAMNRSITPLLFIHMAKTGGTSFLTGLASQLDGKTVDATKTRNLQNILDTHPNMVHLWEVPKEQELDSMNEELKFLGGHLPFGIHTWFTENYTSNLSDGRMTNMYSYTAVFRDPIERAWSHYNYHRVNIKDSNHEKTMGVTFKEWLQLYPFGSNHYTQFLTPTHKLWYTANVTELNIIHSNRPSHEAYLLARRNLLSFDIIGMQDHLNDYILFLKMYYPFIPSNFAIQKKNVNQKKQELTEENRELLREYNNYDMDLYRIALLMYQQQLDSLFYNLYDEFDGDSVGIFESMVGKKAIRSASNKKKDELIKQFL